MAASSPSQSTAMQQQQGQLQALYNRFRDVLGGVFREVGDSSHHIVKHVRLIEFGQTFHRIRPHLSVIRGKFALLLKT